MTAATVRRRTGFGKASSDRGTGSPWFGGAPTATLEVMDPRALADFLRRKRDAITPEAVGLPRGPRRRAVGLRREEVASLVGMSVDYYVRLEQARGPQPSEQMLKAIARALQLSGTERDHLFRLAGHVPPERTGAGGVVRPAVLRVLDGMTDMAAFVVSDLGVVLADNPLARSLLGLQVTDRRGIEASTTWRWFTDPTARAIHPPEDHELHSRVRVSDLRATWSRRRGDEDVEELVARLQEVSEEFARLWADHEVGLPHPDRKRFTHPAVGHVDVDCEVLATPDAGQNLVLLSAPPGSEDDDKLRLIAMGVATSQP